MATKKSSGKRTTIKPRGDARYIRRDSKGRIKESDDVGRSLRKIEKKRQRKQSSLDTAIGATKSGAKGKIWAQIRALDAQHPFGLSSARRLTNTKR
jgi:hypothetical protein